MDDPNITMAEYIQLEEEKARRRGQEYNWETATYTIVYNNTLTSELEVLIDFEKEFPAIVYNDASISKSKISAKPTRIPNIDFFHVFGCPDYIHNHKHHLGKFDEKVDEGHFLGYSLVSKAFRVFNTRRQQTEETYHIIFDKSPDAIKFPKPSVDNINIAKSERYPPDEYLYLYEPSQRYQTNSNNVIFIEPYECPDPVVLETEVSSNQNGQTAQTDEILNDDQSEYSNHTNDE
nr:retrovirus-related Pol polyprotein from transposon TNT 1-94 [Tanacetum cinerariifolium]